MKRPVAAVGVLFGLPMTLVVAAGALNCNSTPLAALASNCALNSDCNSPLVCVFAQCHQQCNLASDCPGNERCVTTGADAGAANVCELPAESICTKSGMCPGHLTCGNDGQCRSSCEPSTGCPSGQICSSMAGASACFDPLNPVDHVLLGGMGADSGPPGGLDGALTDGPTGADGPVEFPDASPDAPFVPTADAGPLPFHPSNFDPTGVTFDAGADGGVWETSPDVEITAPCSAPSTNCLGATPIAVAQNDPDGTLADLYVLRSLTIDAAASLVFSGPRPVILAVLTTVNLQGRLIVSAGGYSAATNPGPGAGRLGQIGGQYPEAGGASYCGVGGKGVSVASAAGGITYGNATLTPLLGGSAGASNSGPGGAGGGAIQIVAGASINVAAFGSINAGGKGGGANSPSSGGSGGAILLEAPAVTIRGNLAANGGGGDGEINLPGGDGTADGAPAPGGGTGFDGGNNGFGGAGSAGTMINGGDGAKGSCTICSSGSGSGGGGAGRIRINAGSIAITGTVSPGPSTPCATQGTLR